jgi:uncharacterized protein (TIGR02186 family)
MMQGKRHILRWTTTVAALAVMALAVVTQSQTIAQEPAATAAQSKKKGPQLPPPVKKPKAETGPKLPPNLPAIAPPETPLPPERVEADVSSRAIAVKADFKGTEIVVFGTVENSRQPSPESGYYDVVVAIEGGNLPATVRRKSRIGGIWINDQDAKFESAPAFYALATSRPLDEITDGDTLAANNIGIDNLRLRASEKTASTMTASEMRDFAQAMARLKGRDGLYLTDAYGVQFTGRSLFRSTIELPANVPLGNLIARVFLFREGAMLSRFTTRVSLERAGVERWIYDAAHNYAWLYGIFTVMVAMGCGLAAASIFGRSNH